MSTEPHYWIPDGLLPHLVCPAAPGGTKGPTLTLGLAARVDAGAPPTAPRLVSSAHGKLARILFILPQSAFQQPPAGKQNDLLRVYRDLLRALPAHTEVVFVLHEVARTEFERWLASVGASAPVTPVYRPQSDLLWHWAEDPFAVLEGNGQPAFVLPQSPTLLCSDLPHKAGQQLRMGEHWSNVQFDGGNILVGDDFVLIGEDDFNRTRDNLTSAMAGGSASPPPAAQLVGDEVRRWLDGRTCHFIAAKKGVPQAKRARITLDGRSGFAYLWVNAAAGSRQPIFHIDMFISLAGRDAQGRYQLVVGDARRGAELSGVALPDSKIADRFDEVAASLTGLGFVVHRNPLPYVHVDVVTPKEASRVWYWASANNVLTEIDGASRTVWLPMYGCGRYPKLHQSDDENRALWERLHFTVRPITDCHALAYQQGSLHCIKKYLARS